MQTRAPAARRGGSEEPERAGLQSAKAQMSNVVARDLFKSVAEFGRGRMVRIPQGSVESRPDVDGILTRLANRSRWLQLQFISPFA
eukprot:COSAG02_NODE_154_length_33067_cov_38.282092_16_plen_86_part_00